MYKNKHIFVWPIGYVVCTTNTYYYKIISAIKKKKNFICITKTLYVL